MTPSGPKMLFQAHFNPRPFIRRFIWTVPVIVAAAAAVFALTEVSEDDVEQNVILFGQAIGILVVIAFAVRGFINLRRALLGRREEVRLFSKGFVWRKGKRQHKYSWSQLAVFREGVYNVHIGPLRLFQRGAHMMKMHDGQVFKFAPRHGDVKKFAKIVHRIEARITGSRMGAQLRNDQSVKVHSEITMWPGGLEIKKREIAWSQLHAEVKNGKLHFYEIEQADGHLRPIAQYSVRSVDNLGGFMEVVSATTSLQRPGEKPVRRRRKSRRP